MKVLTLTAAALVALTLSASAEECIMKDGVKYCVPGTVNVVVVSPAGQKLTVNRPPEADAVDYCASLGGEVRMDTEAASCTMRPDGGFDKCPGACFSKATGEKLDG